MPVELVANGGSDEVCSVGVKAVLHQQVDLTKVDVAQIDRNLFTVADLRPQLSYIGGH